MAFNRHERTLSAKKSSAPIFRKGIPDNREGAAGDVAYVDLSGIGTVQYVKKDNAWIPITSKFDFFTQGEQISQSKTIDGSFVSQLNFYLDKFRTDITDMVNSQIGSWAVHHSITDNWGASQDNYLQYSTFDTNEANSDTRQFVVPFGCKLENIYFYIVTGTNSTGGDVTYAFNVHVKKATIGTSWSDVISAVSFSVVIANGESEGFGNAILNAELTQGYYYHVYVEQTGSNFALKTSKAVSYFSKI